MRDIDSGVFLGSERFKFISNLFRAKSDSPLCNTDNCLSPCKLPLKIIQVCSNAVVSVEDSQITWQSTVKPS